jgi:hypothetical protein
MNKKLCLFGVAIFATLLLLNLASAYTYNYPSQSNYYYPKFQGYSFSSPQDNYHKETYYTKGQYFDYFPGGYEQTSYYTKTKKTSYYYPQYPNYNSGYNYPSLKTYSRQNYYRPTYRYVAPTSYPNYQHPYHYN